MLATYAGRPTPLTLAERFAPGKRLYLKREDLLHTGAHKLNNALGQALLARRLGKERIVAETGAGQHGVAVATAARASGSSASCTWAPRTCGASDPTSSGCGFSARRSSRSRSGRER